jgi:hypothetical protein
MALTPKITSAAANAAVDAIAALCNGGVLKIYKGSQPETADTAADEDDLLASLALSNPAFAAADDGVAEAETITPNDAVQTGEAAWFRVYDDDGDPVFDGSVGTTGCNLNLNSVAIEQYATVTITYFTCTMPKE